MTSIFLYLFIFFISSSLLELARRVKKDSPQNAILAQSLVFVSMLIPSILSGLRDLSVGSDTSGYGISVFDYCCSLPSFSFWRSLGSTTKPDIELGYYLFNYIISRFTSNYFWPFFILSFITILFFYLSIKALTASQYLPIGMLLFYFFYYNESLNLMRQTLAASIVLFGFTYLLKTKYLKFIFAVLLACTFHTMALMCLSFFFFFLLFKHDCSSLKNTIKFLGVVVFGILVLFLIRPTVLFLVNAGLMSSHYAGYVESGYVSLYTNGLILRLPILILCLAFRKELFTNSPKNRTLFALFLFEMVIINSIYLSPWAYRLYAYFGYTKLFLLLGIISLKGYVKLPNNYKSAITFVVVVFSFSWWVYYTAINNSNSTLPYSIKNLSFLIQSTFAARI